ncbi:MAG TPA: EamA family transporter [Amycolatopsis sp.]|nr:EamA family transporter [Amycolatopsis sp.]
MDGPLPGARPAGVAGRALGAIPPTVGVLIGVVSVQLGAALAKQLFTVAGPAGATTLRLFFAALVLSLVWRPSLRDWGGTTAGAATASLARRGWPVVLAYGLSLGLMNLTFYQALARIPQGIAVTIEFLGPLGVALAGSRRLLDALWVLLAAGGVVLLTETRGDLSLLGIAFALAAGVCWAGYILFGAMLGSRSSDGRGLALAMVVAAMATMPAGVAQAGSRLISPWVLMIGLAIALLSSVIPYSLELEALRRIPPRVFGVLMSLEPGVAALAGLLVLHESLRPVQWLALGCVVTASIGATRSTRKNSR